MKDYEILEQTFIDGGVYCLKSMSDKTVIFLCEPVLGGIGKLSQYKFTDNGLWSKTGVQYFLNDYNIDNIKGYFLNRGNYDMLGRLQLNYVLSEDGKFLLKGDIDV